MQSFFEYCSCGLYVLKDINKALRLSFEANLILNFINSAFEDETKHFSKSDSH